MNAIFWEVMDDFVIVYIEVILQGLRHNKLYANKKISILLYKTLNYWAMWWQEMELSQSWGS